MCVFPKGACQFLKKKLRKKVTSQVAKKVKTSLLNIYVLKRKEREWSLEIKFSLRMFFCFILYIFPQRNMLIINFIE